MMAGGQVFDVVVVGAGPAGLAAAEAARSSGATVAMIDEYPTLGGQIYKQPAPRLAASGQSDTTPERARFDRIRASGIHVLTDCLVWNAAPGVLHYRQGKTIGQFRWKALIAACGAYERPAIFPGWSMPGVMTPGGAQTLLKSQGCLPGRKVVLAGCGPFLLPVATTLLRAGAKISGIHEFTHPLHWVRHAAGVLAHRERLAEALGYWRELRDYGVRLRFRHRVVRVEGSTNVERVVLARCRPDGSLVPGTEIIEDADLLLASYGFIPAVQLTRLLGCDHRYVRHRGGWIPDLDIRQATSVPGVFAAGEGAGIGGVHAALAEGSVAGMAAAEFAGHAPNGRLGSAQRAARAQRRFGDLVGRIFDVPETLHATVADETLICRCEDVTAGDLRRAATPWASDVNRVKGVTRCGMGYCQGRICGSAVQSIVADRLGVAPDAVGSFTVRTPLKPLPASALAAYARLAGSDNNS